jgi:hypothetical protein
MKKIILSLFCFLNIANAETIIGSNGGFMEDYLSRTLFPKEVVISKPGGDGVILYSALKSKNVDFAVTATTPLMISPKVTPNYLIDPLEEFDVATVLVKESFILVSSKFSRFSEVTNAKRPIAIGGFGEMSACKAISIFLRDMYGIDIIYVPYKTSAQLSVDVTSGVIDISCQTADVMDTYVKEGRWFALANLGTDKMDLPVLHNFPKFDASFYLLSRHNDPRTEELLAEARKNKELITNKYYRVILPSREDTDTLIKKDNAFWSKFVPKLK